MFFRSVLLSSQEFRQQIRSRRRGQGAEGRGEEGRAEEDQAVRWVRGRHRNIECPPSPPAPVPCPASGRGEQTSGKDGPATWFSCVPRRQAGNRCGASREGANLPLWGASSDDEESFAPSGSPPRGGGETAFDFKPLNL